MNYNDRLNYGTIRMLDVECYKNLFVICLDNPKQAFFSPQDLLNHLWTTYNEDRPCTIVTYNGLGYDFPMLQFAYQYFMTPVTDEQVMLEICGELKVYSNKLIQEEKGFRERLGLPAGVRHIDLLPVCPVMTSLKLLGARLGCESIQDLPYHHESILTIEQQVEVIKYCLHDLEITRLVWEDRKGALDLREWSQKNLSDAQMAERMLVPDRKCRGRNQIPSKVEVFGYTFDINRGNGSPVDPGFPDQVVSGKTYQVGIGGLHSVDLPGVIDLRGVKNEVMLGVDVASMYPSLIIDVLSGIMDEPQERTYREIRKNRLYSKHRSAEISKILRETEGNQSLKEELDHCKRNDALGKIQLNGTYGKLASQYSPLYNPKAMLSVTMSGQVFLLRLIRKMEACGIEVLSANTDGIECRLGIEKIEAFRSACKQWEVETKLVLEEEQVLFVARRDVNNYFLLTKSGKVKTKGIFEPTSIRKSLAFEIIYEAVMVSFGIGRKGEVTATDVRSYITKLSQYPTEFHKFLSVRTVSGGAQLDPVFETRDDWMLVGEKEWKSVSTGRTQKKRVSRPKPFEVFVGGTPVGRVIRWYIGVTGQNVFTPKGGKVPLTDNAVLVQDLGKRPATPIDVEWYIGRAEKLRESLLNGSKIEEEE